MNEFTQGLEALTPEEVSVIDGVIDGNPQFAEIVRKAWPFMAEAFQPFYGSQPPNIGGQGVIAPEQPIQGPQSSLAQQRYRR